MSNTRPIQTTAFINSRGRVYECLRCTTDPYQGEKCKVITHIYRKHTALDQVPFYCNICKFVTSSKSELEKHINPKIYPSHNATITAMKSNNEYVNEAESLLQNLKYFNPKENEDYKRLNKDDSTKIFEQRQRKSTTPAKTTRDDKATSNLLKDILLQCKIPVRKSPSTHTADILPQLLGPHEPSEFNFTIDTQAPPTPILPTTAITKPQPKKTSPTKLVADKTIHHDSSSSSSSSSSSTSSSNNCHQCPVILKELSNLKTEVKTMATAMDQMIKEMEELKKAVNNQHNQHDKHRSYSNYRDNKENHPYRRPHNYERHNRDNRYH